MGGWWSTGLLASAACNSAPEIKLVNHLFPFYHSKMAFCDGANNCKIIDNVPTVTVILCVLLLFTIFCIVYCVNG